MGKKRTKTKNLAVKAATASKAHNPIKKKRLTGSVQNMDDSTYMYMLIIGQLMFDRRHLIAEKLAADMSITAMALASSDALIRIIRESRDIQPTVSSSRKQSSISKNLSLVKGEAETNTSLASMDANGEIVETINSEVDENDDDHLSNDEANPTPESNDIKSKTLRKEPEQNIFSTNSLDTSNIPRETEDGKIIMVYVPQEKFPCPRQNCKQTFLTKENLDYHLVCSRIHNPQFIKDWGCRYCGKEFSGMSHVKHHEKMKHEEHDKEVCHECGRQFDSLEKMKRHFDVHHLQKKYKCKDSSCTMEFASESGAKYHYKRVHLNDQIPCSMEGCPRKFDRNCDLKRHLEKAHRDGGSVTIRSPRKQSQQTQLQQGQPPQLQQQQQHIVQQHIEEQPQQQQQQQPSGQQQILHIVQTSQPQTEPQQPLLPTQYQQAETTYTTMQTITPQITLTGPVITQEHQQIINQEQLQAIQSLQFLQQQQQPQPQQQPQTHQPPPFPNVPTSNYHGGYMYQ